MCLSSCYYSCIIEAKLHYILITYKYVHAIIILLSLDTSTVTTASSIYFENYSSFGSIFIDLKDFFFLVTLFFQAEKRYYFFKTCA